MVRISIGRSLLALSPHREFRYNTEAYRAVLDDYAHDLMHKIDFGSEPEGIMAAINRYIFQTQRYQGNEDNYYSADNSYLNRVIDQRRGNPISLCMIYQLVSRRLGLPMTGIGLPGHFLCRFQTPRQIIILMPLTKGAFSPRPIA